MQFFLTFLVLIAIGLPISIAMGMVPFGYLGITHKYPFAILVYKMFDVIDNFCLIAVPLFILGGNLITAIGVTEKLLGFCNEIVGRFRGGLSHVNVLTSTIFGGLNGSAVGDAAAVGSILIRPMKKMGYSGAYAAAVTAASGTISGIIPPSIPFIILASSVPNISIGALFIGGIIPGILICVGQCAAGYVVARVRNYPKLSDPFELAKFFRMTWDALPALLLVGLIIGGLRSGVFTPTEVASVIVTYALFLGFVVYRNLNFAILLKTLHETAITTGVIFLVIGCAGPFMWLLTRLGVTETLSRSLLGVTVNPVLWWIIVSAFLLVAGMLMDTVANLLIVGPIVYGAFEPLGFDPFVGSIAMVILLTMGTTTPPVGISLFVTSSIAEETIERVSVEVIPFIIPEIVVVMLILLFPGLAKFLPQLFGYIV